MSRPPLSLPEHPDVLIEADDRVWDGRFPLDRIRFRHRRFDGAFSSPRIWEIWRRGRAAAMLPYDPVADAVVLIEQFRLPALAAGLDQNVGMGGKGRRAVHDPGIEGAPALAHPFARQRSVQASASARSRRRNRAAPVAPFNASRQFASATC